ncbi:alcohol oxidase [Exidia glandulosa HHB12029]|uniref:Alcohol oxidase n=1 Tax=Exidia glandulosa HHB12029 TaxID=1314781 RepID=A0A165G031_EXIGL|nr:alcohol oxidase [Exidia glandulosa HHB12029]
MLLLSAVVLLGAHAVSASVTTNVALAANQTFDYIVVGGGLTGITVAARLAENSRLSVLLIEAGADNRNDPRVYDIHKYGKAFNSELDWSWTTDKGHMLGGKTLGGGSSINGATWTRGSAAQYDAWQSLLETSEESLGWNWAGLFSYMKKAENFSAPTPEQRSKGADSVEEYHGTTGPVHVTFPDTMYGGDHQKFFQETVSNITGLPLSRDLNGGEPNCVSFVPNNLNREDSYHRSSSAAAYLTPVESDRANWTTLTTYQVTKLLFSSSSQKPVTVSGVQFKKTNGSVETFTAYARKEVILAAGAIQTPALLQLSGIGDPTHLKSLGITPVVNLTTVGKNLQEQPMSVFGSNSSIPVSGTGPNDVIAYPNLKQLFGSEAANASKTIKNSISAWASSQAGSALNSVALETILKTQADYILNKNAPLVEIFYSTGYPTAIGLLMWTLLPFSRGVVKINSTNPLAQPTIRVNFFSVDFDMRVHVAGSRLARRILTTPPLSTLSTNKAIPCSAVPGGNSATDEAKGIQGVFQSYRNDSTPSTTDATPGCDVPGGNNATDEDWRSWIKEKFNAVSHPIGTAAMMRRNLGGVVDGHLRVYDTKNLRVVDASVIPLQISAHLSSTLFGIAEKAAHLIKADA